MRVVVQRVLESSVTVEGQTSGAISRGVLLLVGFGADDDESQLAPMANKVANLRIFPNDAGRFDRSLIDEKLPALAVPQFTLYADCKKGRRPEFFGALAPAKAEPLFELFVSCLEELLAQPVQKGVFGADMKVSLVNDGPVTITLDSDELFRSIQS